LKYVKEFSPTGFAPILKVPSLGEEFYVSESLAIAEFLAESEPDKGLWPKDRVLRAKARSAAAEMISGFGTLRNDFPSNFLE